MATQQARERMLHRHGITGAQHAALTVIDRHDGITSAELARRCFVTAQTMNGTVSRLAAAGLIERTAHPMHQKLIELRLTTTGRDTYRRADATMSAFDDELAAALPAPTLTTLKSALIEVAARADTMSATAD